MANTLNPTKPAAGTKPPMAARPVPVPKLPVARVQAPRPTPMPKLPVARRPAPTAVKPPAGTKPAMVKPAMTKPLNMPRK